MVLGGACVVLRTFGENRTNTFTKETDLLCVHGSVGFARDERFDSQSRVHRPAARTGTGTHRVGRGTVAGVTYRDNQPWELGRLIGWLESGAKGG